ncbi:uncharacterized protein TM35_000052960 [Trypanosoma theileri]|uniref:Pre-rRNA-processing protein TSR2 n=1 Tax=Trypanosoma theileri TaxID=67003 RepID=A0A1X0P5J5_9TRYP|nr:uncharacterized protein TM35_000052960 [Trypanosoma theileri]ORC91700.1 hypothetical protein TM35_000052960 [Trypanosoma theileri]
MQPQQPQQPQQNLGFQFVREPYRATEVQFQQFVRGMEAVLNQWTALHLVSQHCDAFALQSMFQELVSWFQTDGEVYSDDLELFFENFFAEARSVIIEDDSMKEVGDVLHEMYCRCCQNDFTQVEQFVASLEVYRRVNPVRLSVNGDTGEEGQDDVEISGDIGGMGAEMQQMDCNEEAEGMGDAETAQTQQRSQPKKKNKKNNYQRDSDGWCIVGN